MCDTFCLPGDYSKDGISYFAKNSDRSPNEPHLVIHVPGKHHPAGSSVSCTYISIPQAEYTREMILCKPSWIWGAEMGVNEDKVAIGNEAVFTKAKRGAAALIGMDMLRLALERAGTATAAVETLIMLLETYGQGGNCGFDHSFYYDNSFLAADPKEVYIMETSGKNYAVKRAQGKCAISNRLTIETEHSSRSGIGEKDHFSKRFTEPVYSYFSGAKKRRQQVMDALSPALGTAGLFDILRSHEPGFEGREFTRGSVKSVCMHGGGLIGDHTTGSLVAALRQDKPVTLWCTGASTPCISVFKPVFRGTDTAPVFSDPAGSKEYWLQRERLHRAVIAGLIDVASLRNRIRTLEAEWLSREQQIMNQEVPDTEKLYDLSREANIQEQALIDEFSVPGWQNGKSKGPYARYWRRKNSLFESLV
ncbi:MAG: C69 family dipeptidase [Treponema sp.]|jgi:dipeptidase|nr:C69 family dipeptidase [Treponema sp.]